jgi:hypothetical protein
VQLSQVFKQMDKDKSGKLEQAELFKVANNQAEAIEQQYGRMTNKHALDPCSMVPCNA